MTTADLDDVRESIANEEYSGTVTKTSERDEVPLTMISKELGKLPGVRPPKRSGRRWHFDGNAES